MILYTRQQIHQRISELGPVMSTQLRRLRPLKAVIVLKGGVFFAADLLRNLDHPIRQIMEVEFVSVSSYQDQTKPVTQPRIVSPSNWNVSGSHVLLIDDILETGATLQYLSQQVLKAGALSVCTAVLIQKISDRRLPSFQVDYTGFSLKTDQFLVGFGLDCAGKQRSLPFVQSLGTE